MGVWGMLEWHEIPLQLTCKKCFPKIQSFCILKRLLRYFEPYEYIHMSRHENERFPRARDVGIPVVKK